MTYYPSDRERISAAVIQAAAAGLLCVPPLIAWRVAKLRRSPYLRYWMKVCLVWSLINTLLVVASMVAGVLLEFTAPVILPFVVHFVFCVVGALSSYFNTPFRYWFIANKFCEAELGDVYGQLVGPAEFSHSEHSS